MALIPAAIGAVSTGKALVGQIGGLLGIGGKDKTTSKGFGHDERGIAIDQKYHDAICAHGPSHTLYHATGCGGRIIPLGAALPGGLSTGSAARLGGFGSILESAFRPPSLYIVLAVIVGSVLLFSRKKKKAS